MNSLNVDSLSDVVNDIKRYLNNIQNKELEIENKIKSNEKISEIVIDRFEENFAICEGIRDNKIVAIKKEKLPVNVKEGSVLRYDGNKYVIDFEKSNLLKENIKEITKDLWEN